ncbi:hypothetical protein [Archangium lipolyticum]|uniref:hypothetical protein n=1 Tax=Archangium lipolyticum TaxID=2970465 RepID=UPI00214A7773|nr:hypothetical protein [Archangium lipolyticum]
MNREGSELLSRRRLLVLGSAAGTGLLLWGCKDDPKPAPFDPNAAVPEGLLDPENTGTLSAVEAASLWTVFSAIGTRWKNGGFCTIDQEGLREILDLKTTQTPSYFSEYQLIHRAYEQLSQQYGPERALDELFAIPADAPETTVAGHIRKYTLAELINLQVSHGSFRQMGYLNYPGFMGGTYNDPSHLPYRGA